MEHSTKCQEEFAQVRKEREEYETQWSNYCRNCSGYGQFISSQSVPYGSTSDSFDVSDPCSCQEEGKCPRCGQQLPEDWFDGKEHECPHCHWNWGKNKGDVLPEYPDWCDCMQEEEDRMNREAEEYFNKR